MFEHDRTQLLADLRHALDGEEAAADRAAPSDDGEGSLSVVPDDATTTGLAASMRHWERLHRQVAAAQLIEIAAFDDRQQAADRATPGIAARLNARTVPAEIAAITGTSGAAAAGRVAFARTLVDEHPALLRLAVEGLVSEWHLRCAVKATEDLHPEDKMAVARALAHDIRARHSRGVKELTPPEIARAAARLAIQADPLAAKQRYEKARRQREVSVLGRTNGTAALWIKGPAEQAQHMFSELEHDALARRRDGDERSLHDIMFGQAYETLTGFRPIGPDPMPGPSEPPTEEPAAQPASGRTADPDHAATQQTGAACTSDQADADPTDTGHAGSSSPGTGSAGADRPTRRIMALPPLSAHDLSADDPALDAYADPPAHSDPDGVPLPPPRPQLQRRQRHVEAQVVISAATLLGLDEEPAMLRGYGAIPSEIARQIADNSIDDEPARIFVRRLFCDPVDGRLLTMETRARLFKGPLRQFAAFRDQTCRLFGGPIRDLDHPHEHARGGPTTAANAQALSKTAHVLRDHPHVRCRTEPYQPGTPSDPLALLRANAPNIRWTHPSGQHVVSEPPPALGHASTPSHLVPETTETRFARREDDRRRRLCALADRRAHTNRLRNATRSPAEHQLADLLLTRIDHREEELS
jgi:hypothetical protein